MTGMKDGWRQQNAAYWSLMAIAGDVAKPGCYIDRDDDREKWGYSGNCDLYVYIGATFCEPCGEAVLKLMRAYNPPKEDEDQDTGIWLVPMGCDGNGEDTPQTCDWCGCLLEYHLTEYGVEYEMDHFTHHAPSVPLNRGTAYALARVAEASWAPEVQDVVLRALTYEGRT